MVGYNESLMSNCFKYLIIIHSIAFLAIEWTNAQSISSLKFKTESYDLGVISEDTNLVNGRVSFTNIGTENIDIHHIYTSCSCVEAYVLDSVIPPGISSELFFSFKPKNFPGQIDKQIFVDFNDNTKHHQVLYLTGNVTPSTNPTHNYRYSLGDLWVKQKQVIFRGVETMQVEKIKCYNNSNISMQLSMTELDTINGISFHSDPAIIAPHSSAQLIFKLNPSEWTHTNERIMNFSLQGIDSDSTINHKIRIKIQE